MYFVRFLPDTTESYMYMYVVLIVHCQKITLIAQLSVTYTFWYILFCRFAVRDFEYDPKAVDAERKERESLERDLKRQFVSNFCSNLKRFGSGKASWIAYFITQSSTCFYYSRSLYKEYVT